MKKKLALLSQVITNRVIDKSQGFLKQVSDIPRLYRRTNRELPTKPCTYLIALLDPILRFDNENRLRCSSQVISEWLSIIFRYVYVTTITYLRTTHSSGPENLKKSRPKKFMKSNKSISRKKFLVQFHILQFQK